MKTMIDILLMAIAVSTTAVIVTSSVFAIKLLIKEIRRIK